VVRHNLTPSGTFAAPRQRGVFTSARTPVALSSQMWYNPLTLTPTGFYDSPGWKTHHPRLQILTLEELLGGKTIDMPAVPQQRATFKQAPKAKDEGPEQLALQE